MACSCLSQCFGGRGQEEIPAKITKEVEGNADSVDFYLVQIGTRNGKRWGSTGLDLHDEIPIVSVDESDQFWYLERHENSPLWSFYTKSPEGDKLYVTYNEGTPSDQKVSLEYDGSTGDKSSSRNFMLFLQPDGRYAIATPSPSSLQRLLGANDEVLVLTDVNHPTTYEDWIISNDLTLVVGQSTTSYVQVQELLSPASKWISTNASQGNRVSVGINSEEEWMASGTVSALTFKVPTHDFYASETDGSEVEIIFETDLTKAHMRIISNVRIPSPGVLLQMASNNWYVGTQGSKLELEEQDSLATGWHLVSTRLVFTKQDGTEDIFPAF